MLVTCLSLEVIKLESHNQLKYIKQVLPMALPLDPFSMKKLLSAKFLVYFFVFTSCSTDEAATPNPTSPESLVATKWNWVSYGTHTGDEISMDPQNPISIHFIDGRNIERLAVDENGQTQVTQLTYQISKDTLIAYETREVNYFILKEHTATKLTLSRVKQVNLDSKEVSATPASIFKYIKVNN
jgi:hypothetical protein